jgi:hypothetical protein
VLLHVIEAARAVNRCLCCASFDGRIEDVEDSAI